MFIWNFVADKILGQIVDWFYGQVVGFLGNFFAEMGNMGVELFEMSWVQSIVLFFSYLAWALYGTGLVVACFECGIEYSSGRGNIRETALNAIKGFMAVSLFTVVPVRLYELSVTLQGQLTAGITGYGASIGDVASDIMQEFSAVESLTDLTSGPFLGFGSITSGIMILFCIPKGSFIVQKTGQHPMRTRLRLFLEWDITFEEPYIVPERADRAVAYANREDLERNLPQSNKAENADMRGAYAVSGRGGIAHEPAVDKPRRRGGKQMKTYGEEDL